MPTYKSTVIARQLAENLKLRTGLSVFASADTNGNPTFLIGAGTAGSQSAFVRITQEAATQRNGVFPDEIAQRVYTPHIIQIVVETSATSGLALFNAVNLSKLIYEVAATGVKVELYMSANTNAVGVEDILPANLVVTLNDLWHPLTSTI